MVLVFSGTVSGLREKIAVALLSKIQKCHRLPNSLSTRLFLLLCLLVQTPAARVCTSSHLTSLAVCDQVLLVLPIPTLHGSPQNLGWAFLREEGRRTYPPRTLSAQFSGVLWSHSHFKRGPPGYQDMAPGFLRFPGVATRKLRRCS